MGLGLGVARGRRRADAHGSFREPNPRGMRIAPQAVGAVRCVRRASFDSARASRLCRDTRAEVDLNPVPYLLTDADVRLIEGRWVADGSGFLPRPRARRNKNCGALRFSRVSLKRYVFPDRSEKLWHVHTARARPARAMTFARLWRQLTRWGDIQTPAADIGTPGLPEQKDDAHTSSWWVSSEDLAGEIPTPAWDAVPLDIGTPPPPTPEDTETIPYQVISFILSSGWRDIPAPTRENDPRAVSQQGAIPGLPDHVVSAHILGNMSDPLDIARVLAVSRGMRDAVPVKARAQPHSTGCKACTAVSRGYLNTAKHLHAKGKLQCPTIHCQDCFMENMCALAASNGTATQGVGVGAFHARLSHGRTHVRERRAQRSPNDAQVRQGKRVSVELEHVRGGGGGRAPIGVGVGSGERVPVERTHVLARGEVWKPGGASVGEGKRVSVGRVDVRESAERRARQGCALGARERRACVDALIAWIARYRLQTKRNAVRTNRQRHRVLNVLGRDTRISPTLPFPLDPAPNASVASSQRACAFRYAACTALLYAKRQRVASQTLFSSIAIGSFLSPTVKCDALATPVLHSQGAPRSSCVPLCVDSSPDDSLALLTCCSIARKTSSSCFAVVGNPHNALPAASRSAWNVPSSVSGETARPRAQTSRAAFTPPPESPSPFHN